jgi:hypothetical protein
MIGVIGTTVTSSFNDTYYSAVTDLHNLQFTEFTEFFWTFSIVLYSKKHDVSETGSVSVLK